MISLNIADVSILILLFISMIISVYRGFLREFATAITWIIAGTVAFIYGSDLGKNLSFIGSEIGKQILGTILVFLAVLVLAYGIKFLLFKIFKITGTSKIDRFLGALFGLFRGGVIVIAVLLASASNIKEQDWYKKSQLLPYFNSMADSIAKSVPDSWKKDLSQEMQELNKTEGQAVQKAVESAVGKKPQPQQQPQTTEIQQPTPPSTTINNKSQ